MSAGTNWLAGAADVLRHVRETQVDAIEEAAELFAETIAHDGLVHVFGSGHSRMNVEEMFPRIGSFPGFHPIAEMALTSYHSVVGPNGLRQAMFIEKVEGLGRAILQQIKIHPGDAFLIYSSTGINGTVIELALLLKKMNIPLVGVTSFAHGDVTGSRHRSGKKLKEIVDIPIDNGSVPGDAMVEIKDFEFKVGPGSSIGAIAVTNAIKCSVAEKLVERGKPPVVLASPHFTQSSKGAEQLERVYEEYFRRIGRVYDPQGALAVPTEI